MIVPPGSKMIWTASLLPLLLVLLHVTPGHGNLRLRGDGSDSTYGRLEIYYNGEWGTVCNDGFGKEEARVACRELGLDTSIVNYYDGEKFGPGNGTIWLDEVRCDGSEFTLESCDHSTFGTHDCYHSEDVGISCGAVSGDLRLQGDDADSMYGRLEIFHNGEWGTVCNDGFGQEEARVACRQLGHLSSPVEFFDASKYGPGEGTIWLDEVNCNGFEEVLESCSHSTFGTHDCTHSEDVGISCGTGGSSGGGSSFWGGFGRYSSGMAVFIVIAFSFCFSIYRRKMYLRNQQRQNNAAFVQAPATAMVNTAQTTSYPAPQQQSSEPRPYPVQTYSPVYPPQAGSGGGGGGAQPPNYTAQSYPPPTQKLAPGQAPQYPTELPPVEGTEPYPSQEPGAAPYPPHQTGAPPYPPTTGAPPYPHQQPNDAGNVYPPPQSTNVPEGDLPPPPSYNDIVKQ